MNIHVPYNWGVTVECCYARDNAIARPIRAWIARAQPQLVQLQRQRWVRHRPPAVAFAGRIGLSNDLASSAASAQPDDFDGADLADALESCSDLRSCTTGDCKAKSCTEPRTPQLG